MTKLINKPTDTIRDGSLKATIWKSVVAQDFVKRFDNQIRNDHRTTNNCLSKIARINRAFELVHRPTTS